MKTILKSLFASLFILSALACSSNAPQLQVEETVLIDADVETVWNTVKDFDSLHQWHPAVVASEAQGGNEVGATRTLRLANDATINEVLKQFDAEKMSYQYDIESSSAVGQVDIAGKMHDIPVVPVSRYKAWVTVEAQGDQTKVTWKATFFRAYTGNHQAPTELNDDTAVAAVQGIFRSGLDNLKTQLEQ